MRLRRKGPGGRPGWLRHPGADRLLAMWAMLYPAPAAIDVVRRGSAPRPGMVRDTEFVVLPTDGSRMLVPADRRVGAAMATCRSRLATSPLQRVLWAALSVALRSGLVHAVFRDRLVVDLASEDSDARLSNLSTALGELFGQPVVLGINVGRARANRKPVVHVLDRAGHTLGFCKVGWNTMTRELLGREAGTLAELAKVEFRHIEVPKLLFLHQDGDRDYLVVEALTGSIWAPLQQQAKTLRAMLEIARSGDPACVPLATSAWWGRTTGRADALAGTQAGAGLSGLLSQIEGGQGSADVVFGRWHGDWSPWNMTFGHGRALAWDWERSEPDVPMGFDGLHFALQSRLKDEGMTRSLEDTRLQAADIIGGFQDQQASPVLILELYLVALYLRYAEDAIAIGDPVLAASASDILAYLTQMVDG